MVVAETHGAGRMQQPSRSTRLVMSWLERSDSKAGPHAQVGGQSILGYYLGTAQSQTWRQLTLMRFVPMYPLHFLYHFCSSGVAPGVPTGQSLRYEGQVLGIVLAIACLLQSAHLPSSRAVPAQVGERGNG